MRFWQADSWFERHDGHKGGQDVYSDRLCCYCGKLVKPGANKLHMSRDDSGEWFVCSPGERVFEDEKDFGRFTLPIGPDCLRNHPEFAFAVIPRPTEVFESVRWDETQQLFIFSWKLFAPYRMKKEFTPHGWAWKAGRPSFYQTENFALAKTTAGLFSIKLISNGSHDEAGIGLYEQLPPGNPVSASEVSEACRICGHCGAPLADPPTCCQKAMRDCGEEIAHEAAIVESNYPE